MEYKLTDADITQLKHSFKNGDDAYYEFVLKERFNGDQHALTNEVNHRFTGKLIFNEKQTQSFSKGDSITRRLNRGV